MPTGDEIIFLTRMAERLLGVGIGGMSMYLGYNLFTKLPNRADSSGKMILPGGVSIWLSRVGPGVFFALFGAAIVLTDFMHGITTTSHVRQYTTDATGPKVATEATEERHLRSGMGAVPPEAEPKALQRVKEARMQIRTLNLEWPQALRSDLDARERNTLLATRDYSKRQILLSVWIPDWGSPIDFESWALNGAKGRPPKEEPANIYLLGMEEAPR
jgi:hypothetical protein